MTPKNDKSVAWQITINNPTEEEEEIVKNLSTREEWKDLRYCKYAREEGEERQTPHLHIYLYFKSGTQQRFSWIKKLFPRAHPEECLACPQDNIDYIGNPDYVYSDKRKDDKAGKRKGGICVYKGEHGSLDGIRLGKVSKGCGKLDARLSAIKEKIETGMDFASLFDFDFPIMIRYGKQISDYMALRGYTEKATASALEQVRLLTKSAMEANSEAARLANDLKISEGILAERPFSWQ